MSRAWAWVSATLATALAVGSLLLGLAPQIVEDGSSAPIDCGPALFAGSGLPTACAATFDVWRAAARAGLVLSALLFLLAGALVLLSRRQPAGDARLS